jgi:hypothetical protein
MQMVFEVAVAGVLMNSAVQVKPNALKLSPFVGFGESVADPVGAGRWCSELKMSTKDALARMSRGSNTAVASGGVMERVLVWTPPPYFSVQAL